MRRFQMTVTIFLAMGVLLLATACGNVDGGAVAGKYRSVTGPGERTPATSLDLNPNGQGTWTTEEDSVTFRWESRGEELWLHTKTGGVITGKVSGETVEIHLASAGRYIFQKVDSR